MQQGPRLAHRSQLTGRPSSRTHQCKADYATNIELARGVLAPSGLGDSFCCHEAAVELRDSASNVIRAIDRFAIFRSSNYMYSMYLVDSAERWQHPLVNN
jgi:hypothetical protein